MLSVNYLTKSLKQVFTQQASNERAAKAKKQADQF